MSSVSQAKSIRASIRVANRSPSDSQVPNDGLPSASARLTGLVFIARLVVLQRFRGGCIAQSSSVPDRRPRRKPRRPSRPPVCRRHSTSRVAAIRRDRRKSTGLATRRIELPRVVSRRDREHRNVPTRRTSGNHAAVRRSLLAIAAGWRSRGCGRAGGTPRASSPRRARSESPPKLAATPIDRRARSSASDAADDAVRRRLEALRKRGQFEEFVDATLNAADERPDRRRACSCSRPRRCWPSAHVGDAEQRAPSAPRRWRSTGDDPTLAVQALQAVGHGSIAAGQVAGVDRRRGSLLARAARRRSRRRHAPLLVRRAGRRATLSLDRRHGDSRPVEVPPTQAAAARSGPT